MSFVFLSHASKDKPVLTELVRFLLRHGFPLWIDNPADPRLSLTPSEIDQIDRLHAGEEWRHQIIEAKKNSGCIVACFSKSATTPGALNREERHVWFAEIDYGRTENKLVCCTIDEVKPGELPDDYGAQQIVDICASKPSPHDAQVRTSRSASDLAVQMTLLAADIRRVLNRPPKRTEGIPHRDLVSAGGELASAILTAVRQGVDVEQRIGRVLRVSQRAERLLRLKFNAQGHGLGASLTNASQKLRRLDGSLFSALREFVPLRNRIAHDADAHIDPIELERVLTAVVEGLARHDTAGVVPPSVSPRLRRIHVGPLGMADTQSIVEAIAAATDGSEVFVLPGRYEETVVVDKAISIIGGGVGPNDVVVAGRPDGFVIASDDVTIERLCIETSARNGFAIVALPQVDRAQIKACILSAAAGTAVAVTSDAGLAMTETEIAKALVGLRVEGNCQVRQSAFVQTDNGVVARTRGKLTIERSRFSGNRVDVRLDQCVHAQIEDSSFTAGELGIVVRGNSKGAGLRNRFEGYLVGAELLINSDDADFSLR